MSVFKGHHLYIIVIVALVFLWVPISNGETLFYKARKALVS